jgi:ketol-acid reductoisomerase
VEDLQMTKGQPVKMGQFIARVGNQFGVFPYHLHFDISTTTQLLKQPYYWPGGDKQGVKSHFVDPKAWLLSHHVVNSPAINTGGGTTPPINKPDNRTPAKPIWHVIASNGLDVFDNSLTTANKAGKLTHGSKIMLNESGRKGEGFIWVQIAEGDFKNKWIQKNKVDGENYISTNEKETSPTPVNKPDHLAPAKPIWHVSAQNGLDVFDNSLTTANKAGKLTHGSKIMLNESGRKGEGFIWVQIAEGDFKNKWIQKNKVDGESYISTNPPQN